MDGHGGFGPPTAFFMQLWPGACSDTADPIVNRLSKIVHDRNAERCLENLVPMGRPPPFTSGEGSCIDTVIEPYESFYWLRKLDTHKFQKRLGAYSEDMTGWLSKLRAPPDGPELWRRNAFLRCRSPGSLNKYVPLVIFDDAGPVGNDASADARCYYSVTGIGAEFETRILLGSAIKDSTFA